MFNQQDKIITDFQHYYKTNIKELVLFACRFVASDAAEDIIHDVFLEIWENRVSYEKLPNRSYLFTATRNRCLNFLKRENIQDNYLVHLKTETQRMGLEYYDSIEKQLIERENIQEIYDYIELLPDKCRYIFKLSYLEEKKSAEIAEITGLSIRTVEHQLYLGLKTLREKLQAKKIKKTNNRKFFIFF